MLSLLVLLVGMIFGIYTLATTTVLFHKNLTTILINFFVHHVIGTLGRIVTIMYERQVIKIHGKLFRLNRLSKNVNLGDINYDFPLIISSVLYFNGTLQLISILPMIILGKFICSAKIIHLVLLSKICI